MDGSLHLLRHTFCANVLMPLLPLRRAQILAGHLLAPVSETAVLARGLRAVAHMVMGGVPLRREQILAGHADYATT